MIRRIHIVLMLALSTLLISSCHEDEPINEDTPEENNTDNYGTTQVSLHDYPYGTDSLEKADLYIPEGQRDTIKTIIFIHGGGWQGGDKQDFNGWFDYFKENEIYALINMNYKLSDEENLPIPMQTDDINLVIEKFASEFGINRSGIFLIGASAGAHLALLYAYKYDYSHRVKGVASIVGPTDFTDSIYRNDPMYYNMYHYGIESVFGCHYEDNPEYFSSISPYFFVTSTSPKTALYYGKLDSLVPYTQGTKLYTLLQSYNIVSECKVYENSGHEFNDTDGWDCFVNLLEFIHNNF